MYATRPGLILGFHGCGAEVADRVIASSENLYASRNIYDWLGEGIYFWEQSPERALQYAHELRDNPHQAQRLITTPAVVGVVLDLGFCLDLVNMDNLGLLQESYLTLKEAAELTGSALPSNKKGRDVASEDLLRRELDCLIINGVHIARASEGEQPFDSVRGVFWEGDELYPTVGFKLKNHIQIAIRNPNCVKGYFRPRPLDAAYARV
ncbi:hypothetical protein Q5H93_08475 [Hymenobacter sp. ASUV-10]|uniref:DUF3990 domain-containing protein n=1 Tax=Hymenobacter aranciens TaxID=3063996 RepID=A0ABT9BAG3_9BACT|nr:hypothetical protein [Hymenobacter sp. ASUV-10]MDO7874765.1 hypothetical protein [Hymenobacter sp. ASUV-10]